jgi:hypothetical protein
MSSPIAPLPSHCLHGRNRSQLGSLKHHRYAHAQGICRVGTRLHKDLGVKTNLVTGFIRNITCIYNAGILNKLPWNLGIQYLLHGKVMGELQTRSCQRQMQAPVFA